MTFEKMQQLSAALARAGFAHTVAVGRHDTRNIAGPTELPNVHCRVELDFPRGYALQVPDALGALGAARPAAPLSERIAALEKIGAEFGLVLETGIMNDGLTFSEAKR